LRVVLSKEDALRLERLMKESPDLIGIEITEVELPDAPVGEGEPGTLTTAGTTFRCRVEDTPNPAKVVIQDADGRIIEESPD
jgi:hypothetical protein